MRIQCIDALFQRIFEQAGHQSSTDEDHHVDDDDFTDDFTNDSSTKVRAKTAKIFGLQLKTYKLLGDCRR